MPKVIPITIPETTSVQDLRENVVTHLQRLSQQITQQSVQKQPFSMGNFRIMDLANPGAPGDAVNLRTLQEQIDQVTGNSNIRPVGPSNSTTNLYIYSTSTAALTLTTSMADVPGATGTFGKTGKWMVTGVFDFNNAATDTGGLVGQLVVNGTALTPNAILLCYVTSETPAATVSQTWVVPGTVGWVAKLQAKKVSGAGASTLGTPHSSITALYIGP